MNVPDTHGSACTRCGEIHDPNRCNAHSKRTGQQCGNRAGKGTDHVGFGNCEDHFGSTPNGNTRAQRLELEMRMREMLADAGRDPDTLDPTHELLQVLADAAAMREVLLRLVAELVPEGTEAYVERPEGRDGRELEPNYVPADPAGVYGPDHKGDGKPHVLVTMLGDWSDRAARYAKMAVDAGIDERRVELAEEQARQAAGWLRSWASVMIDRTRELGAPVELVDALTGELPGLLRRAIEQAESSQLIEGSVVDDE